MGTEEVDTWDIGAFYLFVYMDGHTDVDREVSMGGMVSEYLGGAANYDIVGGGHAGGTCSESGDG